MDSKRLEHRDKIKSGHKTAVSSVESTCSLSAGLLVIVTVTKDNNYVEVLNQTAGQKSISL